MGGALSGYRALDLTDEKGMFCARLLADMGAEVIRVEKPQDMPNQQDPSFCYLNLGKRSITLNLETGQGQGLFKQLAKTADVVLESYAPGFLPSIGLDYPRLSQINHRLIMASVTGFGQDGPYRDYKSCDLVLSVVSGQMSVCGDSNTPPLKPFGNQTYYTASLFAAIGVLLAIRERHSSGKGQHIDISAQECAAATLDHVLVRYLYQGEVARRQGSLHWNSAFRVFPCKDGYILLSMFQHWETLIELLASEGMADDLTDEKWQDRDERLTHIEHIISVLERWTKLHTAAELEELGQLMRFTWAKVASVAGLSVSPQLEERGFFMEVECEGKKGLSPGAAVKMSSSPWQVGNKVPKPGESNETIYQAELGLSPGEIETLRQEGAI